jgi:hypothetical protein
VLLSVVENIHTGQPQAAAAGDAHHVLQESVASLHAAYFAQGPYTSWKAKSNVKLLDRQLSRFVKSRSLVVGRSVAAENGRADGSNAAGFTGVSDAPEWVQQLAQLALYFLLWTEAANLRHTPELLWLLYHIMLSSSNFNKVWVWGVGTHVCSDRVCLTQRAHGDSVVHLHLDQTAGVMQAAASVWHVLTTQQLTNTPPALHVTTSSVVSLHRFLPAPLPAGMCCAGVVRHLPLLPAALAALKSSQRHAQQCDIHSAACDQPPTALSGPEPAVSQ